MHDEARAGHLHADVLPVEAGHVEVDGEEAPARARTDGVEWRAGVVPVGCDVRPPAHVHVGQLPVSERVVERMGRRPLRTTVGGRPRPQPERISLHLVGTRAVA